MGVSIRARGHKARRNRRRGESMMRWMTPLEVAVVLVVVVVAVAVAVAVLVVVVVVVAAVFLGG